jgi:hypothetical protein
MNTETAPLPSAPPSEEGLLEATVALKAAAALVQQRAIAAVDRAQRRFVQTTRQHPYALMSTAFGGGFVAGGGLASPLARSLLGAGLRTAGALLLEALQTFAQPPAPSAPSQPSSWPARAQAASPSSTSSLEQTSPPTSTTEALHTHAPPLPEDPRCETSPQDPSFAPHV